MRRSRTARSCWSVLLPFIASLAMFACGTGPSAGNGTENNATENRVTADGTTTKEDATATTTVLEPEPTIVKEAGVFFPTLPNEARDIPSAFTIGKLFVEDDCIRVAYYPVRVSGDLVVWPYSYSPSREGDEIYIRNEKGEVVTRVGDKVKLGGGQITRGESGGTPEEERRNYQEKRRELGVPDQCRGPLWVAGTVQVVSGKAGEETTG